MNNKKAIGIAIGVIATGFTAYKVITGKEPQKYSSKWFDMVSDEVLDAEREIVRQQYCSSGNDISLATRLYNLLNQFDKVMSKRAWDGKEPGFPVHSEHGWHLPSDD